MQQSLKVPSRFGRARCRRVWPKVFPLLSLRKKRRGIGIDLYRGAGLGFLGGLLIREFFRKAGNGFRCGVTFAAGLHEDEDGCSGHRSREAFHSMISSEALVPRFWAAAFKSVRRAWIV